MFVKSSSGCTRTWENALDGSWKHSSGLASNVELRVTARLKPCPVAILAISLAELGFEDLRLATRTDDLHRNNDGQNHPRNGVPKHDDETYEKNLSEHIYRIANPGVNTSGHEFSGFSLNRKRSAPRVTSQNDANAAEQTEGEPNPPCQDECQIHTRCNMRRSCGCSAAGLRSNSFLRLQKHEFGLNGRAL
jgi:hypothetical protein